VIEGLVGRGKITEKSRKSIAAAFRAEPVEALEWLVRACGPGLGQWLAAAVAAEGWAELESRAGAVRRALMLRQATRRPFRTLGRLVTEAVWGARQAARPPGLTVVLCGADGSGKSTAAGAIIQGLRPTFSPERGREFHWKPAVFSAGRMAARGPVTDPHGRPPRSAPVSWLFFGVHWLEFFLGWPWRVWPVTARGGLVLIDRFYYDFFVDQRRYRMRVPGWLVRLGYRLLAKPDLVLLLDAPAEVLQGRKAEVSLAETERQRTAFLELVRGLPNGRVVDAAQRPEEVAAQCRRFILDFLAERMARRVGVTPEWRPGRPGRG
jgi:thymidylate kinase